MAYYDVQDVKKGGSVLYVLASDNLYSYNEGDGSIQTYDKVNGLSDCGIAKIEWNSSVGKLIIVYSDYNIDMLDAKGNITNLSDFYSATISGDKTVKLSLLRALGLSPARITKYNSRHMLRSLAEVIRMGGYSGLLVLIDDLEILQSRTGMDGIHYTKLRREDTYESIRQLIDEIDSLRGIMFVFAFDRVLMDNDNAGLPSYQALWMRIQNEIVGERFNRFTDIADLDVLAYQVYTPEYLVSISEKIAQKAEKNAYAECILNVDEAKKLIEDSRFAGTGLPGLVREAWRASFEDRQEAGTELADGGRLVKEGADSYV